MSFAIRRIACCLYLLIYLTGVKILATNEITFRLNDNTPADQLIGNVLSSGVLFHTEGKHFSNVILDREDQFRLSNNGDLFTKGELDRDKSCTKLDCCQKSKCEIRLTALLFGSQPSPIQIDIIIVMTDENDNKPVFRIPIGSKIIVDGFEADFQVTIPESASQGSVYTLPAASDADSYENNIRHYSLHEYVPNKKKSEKAGSQIEINYLDGGVIAAQPFSLYNDVSARQAYMRLPAPPKLQVTGALDREQMAGYWFLLVAEDSGNPPLSSQLRLYVNITDVNDNAPQFVNLSQSGSTEENALLLNGVPQSPGGQNHATPEIEIAEDTRVGAEIYRFSAKDEDFGENGRITYSIDWSSNQESGGISAEKFVIDPNQGSLRVNKALDYEAQSDRRVSLVIVAKDHGIPQLSTSTSLVLKVTDVNDNAPEIEVRNAAGSRSENSVTQFNSEPNKQLPVEGNESPISKDVPVVAGLVNGVLQENYDNQEVLRLISVSDADTVSDGLVTCSLAPNMHSKDQFGESNSNFELKRMSPKFYMLLNRRKFDYELDADSNGELEATIICQDEAQPRLETKRIIKIPLGDVNDNWPQFDRINYQFSISEDARIGSLIGRIHATDRDSGSRGNVRYFLSAQNPVHLEYVTVKTDTGELKVARHLDREKLDKLELTVTAADEGNGLTSNRAVPSKKLHINSAYAHESSFVHASSLLDRDFPPDVHTNTTSLTIIILDVNDNAPQYVGEKELHILENTRKGSVIVERLQFEDPDLGENSSITVCIQQLNTFQAYPSSLAVERNVNFRSRNLPPTGGCSDARNKQSNMLGHLSSSSSSLDTDDINNNGNGQQTWFSLDEKLALRLIASLDREKQESALLRLIAYDNSKMHRLTTTTTIRVIVDDINDNAPQLVFPKNCSLLEGLTDTVTGGWFTPSGGAIGGGTASPGTFSNGVLSSVPSNTPRGVVLVTVKATDIDAAENGKVTFHLKPALLGTRIGLYTRKPLKVDSLYASSNREYFEDVATEDARATRSNMHRFASSQSTGRSRLQSPLTLSSLDDATDEVDSDDYVWQVAADGFGYFAVNQFNGQIVTNWLTQEEADKLNAERELRLSAQQNKKQSSPLASELKNSSSVSEINPPTKSGTVSQAVIPPQVYGPPEVGLYALLIDLRDGAPIPSQKVTQAIFYINVSEPTGYGFGSGGFASFWGLSSDSTMSHAIVLILIVVCSLALVISVTAAVFWVRFRVDNNVNSNGNLVSGPLPGLTPNGGIGSTTSPRTGQFYGNGPPGSPNGHGTGGNRGNGYHPAGYFPENGYLHPPTLNSAGLDSLSGFGGYTFSETGEPLLHPIGSGEDFAAKWSSNLPLGATNAILTSTLPTIDNVITSSNDNTNTTHTTNFTSLIDNSSIGTIGYHTAVGRESSHAGVHELAVFTTAGGSSFAPYGNMAGEQHNLGLSNAHLIQDDNGDVYIADVSLCSTGNNDEMSLVPHGQYPAQYQNYQTHHHQLIDRVGIHRSGTPLSLLSSGQSLMSPPGAVFVSFSTQSPVLTSESATNMAPTSTIKSSAYGYSPMPVLAKQELLPSVSTETKETGFLLNGAGNTLALVGMPPLLREGLDDSVHNSNVGCSNNNFTTTLPNNTVQNGIHMHNTSNTHSGGGSDSGMDSGGGGYLVQIPSPLNSTTNGSNFAHAGLMSGIQAYPANFTGQTINNMVGQIGRGDSGLGMAQASHYDPSDQFKQQHSSYQQTQHHQYKHTPPTAVSSFATKSTSPEQNHLETAELHFTGIGQSLSKQPQDCDPPHIINDVSSPASASAVATLIPMNGGLLEGDFDTDMSYR